MYGNGRRRISCRLRVSPRTRTKTTRSRGSIRARCCAGERSPPARGLRAPAIATSSRRSATTSSPGSAPAPCEQAGAASTVDKTFHKHSNADRESDHDEGSDCHFKLHARASRNNARHRKSLLRYSWLKIGLGCDRTAARAAGDAVRGNRTDIATPDTFHAEPVL